MEKYLYINSCSLFGWEWSNRGMVLKGENEVLGEKVCTEFVVVKLMTMGQCRNGTAIFT